MYATITCTTCGAQLRTVRNPITFTHDASHTVVVERWFVEEECG